MSNVIKRDGTTEPYNAQKLASSITASLAAAGSDTAETNSITSEIIEHFSEWIKSKQHVTSKEIRKQVTHILADHHSIAAYLYTNHRIVA